MEWRLESDSLRVKKKVKEGGILGKGKERRGESEN